MRFGKRSLVLVGLVLFLGATLASAYVGLTPKWTRKYYEAGTNLRSACTFGSSGGYMVAVGSDNSGNPKAIKTMNQGNTWTHITNLESAAAGHHLTGVWCVDGTTWYAVGWKAVSPNKMRGTVFKTADGGSNWTLQTIPYSDSIPFYDVMFGRGNSQDKLTGWIAAGEGWVYKTANGGSSWTREQPLSGDFGHHYWGIWVDPTSNNAGNVWAVGDAGTGTNAHGIVAKKYNGVWSARYPLSSSNLDFYHLLSDPAFGGGFNEAYVGSTEGFVLDTIPGPTNPWAGAQVVPSVQTFYGFGGGAYVGGPYCGLTGSEGLIGNTNGTNFSREMDSVAFDLKAMSVFRSGDLGVTYTAIAVGQDGRVFWGGASGSGFGPSLSATPGDKKITLTLDNTGNPNDAIDVHIEKATCPDGEWFDTWTKTVRAYQTLSWDDLSATNDIDYYYRIMSSLNTYIPSPVRPLNGWPLPPVPAPSNLTVGDVAGDQGGALWLHWLSGWLDPIPANTAIYRSEGGRPYVLIGVTSTSSGWTNWTDNNALTGEQKTYKIRNRKQEQNQGAYDWVYSNPCSSPSGTAVDNTAPAAPGAPNGQVYTDGNNYWVRLMWSLATERDVAGWNVYRSSTAGGTYFKRNNSPVPRPSYLDPPLTGWNYYKISAVDRSGNESARSNYVSVYFMPPGRSEGGGQSGGLADRGWTYALNPASPNPTGPGTVGISFSLPEQSVMSLVVYDVQGRKVRSLASGSLTPGLHSVAWDGKDESGKPVKGGVYFYRLEAGKFSQTRKLVLVR